MKSKKAVVIIGLLIVFTLLLSANAFTSVGVGLTPTSYDLEIKQTGVHELRPMTIKNSGDQEESFFIKMVGLGQDIRGSAVFLDDPKDVALVEKYFAIEPKEFNLKTGGQRDASITITIPEEVGGGVYAGFLVLGVPTELAKSGKKLEIGSYSQVASILEIKLPGPHVIDGVIEDMLIEELPDDKALSKNEKERLDAGKKLPWRLNLAPVILNTGNVHYKPSGHVIVKTEQMEEIGKPKLIEQNILPKYRRAIDCPWNPGGPLPDGKYLAEAHVFVDKKELVYEEWFIIADGGLAYRAGEIIGIDPSTVEPNKPVNVDIRTKNTGSLPYEPAFKMRITNKPKNKTYISHDDFSTITSLLNVEQIKPFPTSTQKTLQLNPEEKTTSYTVQIIMSYEGSKYEGTDQELDRWEGSIIVKEKPPWWKILWNWFIQNWWKVAIALLALISLLFFLLWLLKWRKKRCSYCSNKVERHAVRCWNCGNNMLK
jgi:hypothetical protein